MSDGEIVAFVCSLNVYKCSGNFPCSTRMNELTPRISLSKSRQTFQVFVEESRLRGNAAKFSRWAISCHVRLETFNVRGNIEKLNGPDGGLLI